MDLNSLSKFALSFLAEVN